MRHKLLASSKHTRRPPYQYQRQQFYGASGVKRRGMRMATAQMLRVLWMRRKPLSLATYAVIVLGLIDVLGLWRVPFVVVISVLCAYALLIALHLILSMRKGGKP